MHPFLRVEQKQKFLFLDIIFKDDILGRNSQNQISNYDTFSVHNASILTRYFPKIPCSTFVTHPENSISISIKSNKKMSAAYKTLCPINFVLSLILWCDTRYIIDESFTEFHNTFRIFLFIFTSKATFLSTLRTFLNYF